MMATANLSSSVTSLHSLTHRSSPLSFEHSPSTTSTPSPIDAPLPAPTNVVKAESSSPPGVSSTGSGPASLTALLSHSPSPPLQQQSQASGVSDVTSGKRVGEKSSHSSHNQSHAPRNTLGYQFTSLFPPPAATTRTRTTTSLNDPFDLDFDSPTISHSALGSNSQSPGQLSHSQPNPYSFSGVSSINGRRKANLTLNINGKPSSNHSQWPNGITTTSLSASTNGPISLQGYLNPLSLQNSHHNSSQLNGMASLTQAYPMDNSAGHYPHSARMLSHSRGVTNGIPPIASINGHSNREDETDHNGIAGVHLDADFDLDLDNYDAEEEDDLNQIDDDEDQAQGLNASSVLLRDFQGSHRRDYSMGSGIGAGSVGSNGLGVPIGLDGESASLAAMGVNGSGTSTSKGFSGLLGKSSSTKEKDKQVRRRSSKACDQCRKSKCKCERGNDNEPCKSCIMLGTQCTFLGPSRKRGPPKGYIDAIESRLHQTEAVLGVLIAVAEGADADPRAKGVLEDLCDDGMAREIIKRVGRGVYGRGRSGSAGPGKPGALSISGDSTPNGVPGVTPPADALEALASTPGTALGRGRMVGLGSDKENGALAAHPSNEWQDLVTAHIKAKAKVKTTDIFTSEDDTSLSARPPRLTVAIPESQPSNFRLNGGLESEKRMRQRRRLDSNNGEAPNSAVAGIASAFSDGDLVESPIFAESNKHMAAETSPVYSSSNSNSFDDNHHYGRERRKESPLTNGEHYSGAFRVKSHSKANGAGESVSLHSLDPANGGYNFSSDDQLDAELDIDATYSDENGLAEAVGQLSLNEDAQIRYHGKASGLHLLMSTKPRVDRRDEGGIWHFPKARVWPPANPMNLRSSPLTTRVEEEDILARAKLPRLAIQEELLDLYFTYVHPILPIVHKKSFLEAFHAETKHYNSYASLKPDSAKVADSVVGGKNSFDYSDASNMTRISPLLLLAMFAIGARYASFGKSDTPIPPEGEMWTAGDQYLEDAKVVLDRTYASSRPSTCQALLLMAYREIGIGAMAQSWLYVGMAVRMAQDLGMHRSSDRWQRVGELIFSPTDIQVRRRIWYACSIMDKYVSTYIGRPLSIFEHDFDTQLPDIDDDEEMEFWEPHSSIPAYKEMAYPPSAFTPVPCRLITRFNASARLSTILASIVHAIYAVRPVLSRHSEALQLEKALDKWYHELPPHLQHEPTQKHPVPTPHVLTLHMQYWCAVLLLHRPFIRHYISFKLKNADPSAINVEVYNVSKKNYDYCVIAANHITSIVALFAANFCLARSAVFLTYYMFTASIMHVTTLALNPGDPQARAGLAKCMEALKKMGVAWPSAERAWELLDGAKDDLTDGHVLLDRGPNRRNKRPLGDGLDDSTVNSALNRADDNISLNHSDTSGSHQYSPSVQIYNNAITELDAAGNSNSDPNLNYFSTYDRWTSDNSLVFPPGLSTSVLPQQYSTGFIENRGSSAAVAEIGHGVSAATHATNGANHSRIQQYWNDYSSLGQPSSMLTSIYGMSILPGNITHMGDGEQSHQSANQNGNEQSSPIDHLHNQSSLYMGDQYNLFGSLTHT